MSQSQVSREHAEHGVAIRAGRNGAVEALAGDLPTAVLVDLTGLSLTSATAWARRSRSNWHAYLAERVHQPTTEDDSRVSDRV
ncbi:hypothetical protein [Streptodolium elevatio]|uniref:Transposase n=1 Tax=Streptodolium elevatio TaxID=3157996 RepID=A0ABV3DQ33_9ACTN